MGGLTSLCLFIHLPSREQRGVGVALWLADSRDPRELRRDRWTSRAVLDARAPLIVSAEGSVSDGRRDSSSSSVREERANGEKGGDGGRRRRRRRKRRTRSPSPSLWWAEKRSPKVGRIETEASVQLSMRTLTLSVALNGCSFDSGTLVQNTSILTSILAGWSPKGRRSLLL